MKDRREIFKNKRAAGTSPGCGKDKKMEEVKVWQEDMHIPTYEPGEPQKNLMFLEGRVYQGSSGKVYPYRCGDRHRFVQSHLISYYTRLEGIGTMAVMKLDNDTKRTSREVFDTYAPLEEGFVKTEILLREMCPLGDPVARSQARRILRRLDEFKEVVFDFRGIDFMGQGFADEVFRVFQNRHPDITLTVVNANASVQGMIRHVRR